MKADILHFLSYSVFLLILSLSSVGAGAVDTLGGDIPEDQRARAVPMEVEKPQATNRENADNNRVDWRSGRYGAISNNKEAGIRPFGADLFAGGFRGMRADGLNPHYRIMPGDMITLKTWGAVEMDLTLPVDSQGNIFIPSVGPVPVKGVNENHLDELVRKAIQRVYPFEVNTYTRLQGVQPVALFVTGFVKRPGRYAGTPSDSLLYFLDQAGGIDGGLGSYRRVRILRKGKTIATVDLYDFIQSGTLPRPQFRDGDTVLVERRGDVVTVQGDVQRPYQFELRRGHLRGRDVLHLARLKAGVSHVLLRGARPSGPIAVYYAVSEFGHVPLRNGDDLVFSADEYDDTIVVQLEGSFFGPSRYVLPKGFHLLDLLNNVPVPRELTDTTSVSIRRVSVAERQAKSLRDSLRRLETSYLGASSQTVEEANIRVQEAKLIQEFVAKASKIKPTGRLVVAHHDKIANIRLQDGDVIAIPERLDSVLISGEVKIPRAVVFKSDLDLEDYIDKAGGYTNHADTSQILIVRQNGEVRYADDVTLKAGDEILVLPEAPTKNLQLAASISQILYQLAVAANVALNL